MAVYEYPMRAYNRVQATLRVTVTEPTNKISVANNTSVLHVTMQLINNNNTPSHNANCTIYLNVNGSRVYTGSSFDIRGGVTQTFYDQDVTISHNTAGDASVPIYAYFKSGVSIGTAEISQTFVCTTIPRKTDVSLSASSTYFGNSITIYCPKKSSSFTNKLYYKIDSGSWNVLNANAGDSMAWTIPMSLIANIPNDMSCTISILCYTYNGSTFIGESSAAFTAYVPSSARTAPSLNTTDIYLRDGTVGITLSPYAGTWQHIITYSMGNASGYIASSMTTNKSFTFRPPIELAQQIPNANSGTLTITVYTYNGSGTHVGTTSSNITVRVPSDILPSVASVAVTEAVQLVTNNFVGFVQNLSQLLVNISASGAQGSTISSYKTTIEGISYLGAQFTSGVIKTTGEVEIATTVTDSRGRTASGNTAITVMPYVEPSLEIAARADGTKVLVELVGSVSSVNEQNTKELTLKYKKTSDAYFSAPETIPLSDWQFDIAKEVNVDASETTYEFVAVLTDKIKSNEKTNMTGIVAISRRAGGKGVTFGGEATQDGLVSEWDAQFNKSLKVGSVDYTITDEEYAELEALIASISVGGVRIIDWIFPVGHIIQTTNSNYNPNKVFKGTEWTRIKDRFLLSAGDTYAAGETGGEASHTLTINEMPSHRHYLKYGGAYIGYLNSNASQSNGEPLYKYNVPRENALHGEDMGGSQPHNNMPPFLTVYTWQRIS